MGTENQMGWVGGVCNQNKMALGSVLHVNFKNTF
jgi:hypothetical protein